MSTEPTNSEGIGKQPVVGDSGSRSMVPESMLGKIVLAIIGAVVGAVAGVIATALIQPIVQVRRAEEASSRMRRESNVPELMGTKWKTEWQYDDGSPPLKDDLVTFSKWTKDNLFAGYGEITYPNKQYKYSITGEVSPARVVVLNYKAERYPTEVSIGTACLQLSGNAEDLFGNWIGLQGMTQSDGTEKIMLRSGKVTMHRIRNSNP